MYTHSAIDMMGDGKFQFMSSQLELDPGPHNWENPTVWRFPIGSSTNDLNINDLFIGVNAEHTWDTLYRQYMRYGYAAGNSDYLFNKVELTFDSHDASYGIHAKNS